MKKRIEKITKRLIQNQIDNEGIDSVPGMRLPDIEDITEQIFEFHFELFKAELGDDEDPEPAARIIAIRITKDVKAAMKSKIAEIKKHIKAINAILK